MTSKRWVILTSSLVLALIVFFTMQYYAPDYRGPKNNHFNGLRFSNQDGLYAPLGFISLLKWRFGETHTPWPAHRNNLFVPAIKERIMGAELKVTFVGHASVLLQTQGLNILADPIWSERASPVSFSGPKRVHAPGISFSALPPIDVVLISHNHYDHLDLPTLKRLEQQFHPVFIAGLGSDRLLKQYLGPRARVVTLDWWQHYNMNADNHIVFVPAVHWSRRSLLDTNKQLWGGFVIQTPTGNIYFSGDTGFGDGATFARIAHYGPFRLALLPIGAYAPRWFMQHSHVDPAESVAIFKILKAQYAMAIHFSTFHLTDEGIDEPLIELQKALTEAHLSQQRFRALQVGEEWYVPQEEKQYGSN